MAIKYKPIKKGKALPRRKKKDIFPKEEKGLKKKVSGVKTKIKLAKVKRQAKKGSYGPAQGAPRKKQKSSKLKAAAKRVKSAVSGKLTKAGRSKSRRKKTLKKLESMPKGSVGWTKPKGSKFHMTPGKRKMLGSKKGTKIRKGAVGAKVTEGGVYAKYEKKSKAAGSFRKAFKKGCASGKKSFSWDGRSYSCKKK